MKTILVVLSLFLGATNVYAQEWILVASSEDGVWYIKGGSLEFNKQQATQKSVASVLGKVDYKNGEVAFRKWYVLVTDCDRSMGEVVTCDLDGTYLFENNFVKSGGNVASSIAESICAGADYVKQETFKKSLY